MSTTITTTIDRPKDPARPAGRRRWLGLGVVSLGQLLVAVDLMVMLVALPTIAHSLRMSASASPWIVTIYALTYGALLLLGGWIADYGGRKRAFILGITGFAVASLLGSVATDSTMLLGARALQGVSAALLMPAGLSLLSVMFTDPQERARALGIYSAVAASGIALGMVLGGYITEYLSWRWCLLVNVPICVVVLACAVPILRESNLPGRPRFDFLGAALGPISIALLVYACANAGPHGWGDPVTVGCLVASAVGIATFIAVEARSAHPLLPLELLREPSRAGGLIGLMLALTAVIGVFLFLIYYLQGVRHWSAVECGLALLPYATGAVLGAVILERPVGRVRPQIPIVGGLCVVAAVCVWFNLLGLHWSYAARIAPALFVMGLGIVCLFVSASAAVLDGTSEEDAGICSALFNVVQELGFAVGPALLTSVAIQATHKALRHGSPTAVALLHGYHVGDFWAGALGAVGAVVCVVMLRHARSAQST